MLDPGGYPIPSANLRDRLQSVYDFVRQLVSSVYQSYFRTIASSEVIKLQHRQAIVDAMIADDNATSRLACQVLLKEKD